MVLIDFSSRTRSDGGAIGSWFMIFPSISIPMVVELMEEVLPVSSSCLCLKTAVLALPLPSSSFPVLSTPIRVDFPASTFPSETIGISTGSFSGSLIFLTRISAISLPSFSIFLRIVVFAFIFSAILLSCSIVAFISSGDIPSGIPSSVIPRT